MLRVARLLSGPPPRIRTPAGASLSDVAGRLSTWMADGPDAPLWASSRPWKNPPPDSLTSCVLAPQAAGVRRESPPGTVLVHLFVNIDNRVHTSLRWLHNTLSSTKS